MYSAYEAKYARRASCTRKSSFCAFSCEVTALWSALLRCCDAAASWSPRRLITSIGSVSLDDLNVERRLSSRSCASEGGVGIDVGGTCGAGRAGSAGGCGKLAVSGGCAAPLFLPPPLPHLACPSFPVPWDLTGPVPSPCPCDVHEVIGCGLSVIVKAVCLPLPRSTMSAREPACLRYQLHHC